MSNQVTGKIKTIFPTETKGNFSLRVLWIVAEHDTQYPQTLEIQFPKDKANLLDKCKEGDIVTVSFNLRGRVWNNGQKDQVFNTLSGWRIEAAQGVQQSAPVVQPANAAPLNADGTPMTKDDLPF